MGFRLYMGTIVTLIAVVSAQVYSLGNNVQVRDTCEKHMHWHLFLAQSLETGDSAEVHVSPVRANKPTEAGAFKRSLLYTLVPLPTLILAAPALVVGPSTGYFYGDVKGRAWLGIGIRTLALGGMLSSFAICGWDCGPGESSYDIAWVVFGGSSAILAGSAIYDIATVKRAVRARNSERMMSLAVVRPYYLPKSRTVGIVLSMVL